MNSFMDVLLIWWIKMVLLRLLMVILFVLKVFFMVLVFLWISERRCLC